MAAALSFENESHSKQNAVSINTNGLMPSIKADIAAEKMNCSLNSNNMEDTSPSDSGVQLLDSESSELMAESITSQTAGYLEEDETFDKQLINLSTAEPAAANIQNEPHIAIEEPLDTNSNITTTATQLNNSTIDDSMTTSACSTFDTTENIVYRRKARKSPAAAKAPKKRVSFHEDILKNTRTDNIHIEHGFITYKNARKLGSAYAGNMAGRYSWCSEGEAGKHNQSPHSALCEDDDDAEYVASINKSADNSASLNRRNGRRIVYRNACSDVLDYGNSDIYDTHENNALQYDNTGVFEYVSNEETVRQPHNHQDKALYQCSCSSNSSLDSDESDKNCNREEYGKAKSSSCDCIGNNSNNNFIGK